MTLKKLGLRPSNTERFLNCNLYTVLPEKPKTKEQLAYLEERCDDHTRLFKEEFLESEAKCKHYHDNVVKRCKNTVFREVSLSSDLNGCLFEGTPDLFAFDRADHCLHIIDYKTGFHNVNAHENMQLLSYACLVMLNHIEWEIECFSLAILNTQGDIVSTYSPRLEAVLTHMARLEKSLQFTSNQKTFYATSGKWCMFCPSKNYCPLMRDVSQIKSYMDMETDKLIYEKETRAKEVKLRMAELKKEENLSEFFDYDLVMKKRYKHKKDLKEDDDILVTKKMTAAEAQKILDPIDFSKYFDEEEFPCFSIRKKL